MAHSWTTETVGFVQLHKTRRGQRRSQPPSKLLARSVGTLDLLALPHLHRRHPLCGQPLQSGSSRSWTGSVTVTFDRYRTKRARRAV